MDRRVSGGGEFVLQAVRSRRRSCQMARGGDELEDRPAAPAKAEHACVASADRAGDRAWGAGQAAVPREVRAGARSVRRKGGRGLRRRNPGGIPRVWQSLDVESKGSKDIKGSPKVHSERLGGCLGRCARGDEGAGVNYWSNESHAV